MVNVFSFCLYGGRNPRYYIPLLENIQIIAQYFPEWKAYIYIAPDVDAPYVDVLRSHSNVTLRETNAFGAENMISRFCAIDEPDVDIMFVRDADSLIHWKDRWAIHQFLAKPEFIAHTIRDHPHHVSYLMGGLWGIRKSSGLCIRDMYNEFLKSPHEFGLAHDQNFLCGTIYPAVRDKLLVHHSNSRLRSEEHGEEFPFAWTDALFCGRVEYSQTTPFLPGLPSLNRMRRS